MTVLPDTSVWVSYLRAGTAGQASALDGLLAAQLRERGETVPLTDLEIAVAAESAGAQLWSWDGDFDRAAHVLPQLVRYSP